MHVNFYLSPLIVALALTVTTPATAADSLPLDNISFSAVQQKFQLLLPGNKHNLEQGRQNADTLVFLKQHTDNRNISHIRMQQYYKGIPVYGGYAIFHSPQTAQSLLKDNTKTYMNGTVYEGLHAELGTVNPNFSKNGGQALAKFKAIYTAELVSEEKVTPLIYIDENERAHWAYQVSVLVTPMNKIPERPTAIVDALTNQTFISWDDIKTKRVNVNGKGFGGNTKIGSFEYGIDLPLLELTRDAKLKKCYMENTDVKIIDMKHRYSSNNKPMEFNCSGGDDLSYYMTGYKADGYDKINGAYSPTNDALYSGYVIKHMFHDWYNLEALRETNGNPMQLIMRVHYGYDYENAYWDGSQMTFGDGESMMYPLVSLGIAAHEITHGFTEQHSDLQYYGQSGGMNEAFSDMSSQAAEFYSVAKNTWVIGAEVMKEDSGYDALRYMDKPSRDGSSIDSAKDYRNGLDVHYSSGVYNRLYYLLSTSPGWDTRLAYDVMVKANVDYWTPNSNFIQGGCGLLNAAVDLSRSVSDVKKALDKVDINYSKCVINKEHNPLA